MVPSLHRLLTLKDSTGSFQDDLAEASAVLQAPDELQTSVPIAKKEHGHAWGLQKRAEWLLKWLLEKLNTTQPGNASHRTNPQAWTLFESLVSACSVLAVARQLTDARFLGILKTTLAELEETLTSSTAVEVLEPSKTSSKPSKKRKRGSGVPDAATDATASHELLFSAIQRALQVLANSTGPTVSTRTGSEQLKIALKAGLDDTIELLRLWLSILMHGRLNAESHALSAILPIWKTSISANTSDVFEVASKFSETCLTLILQLLVRTQAVNGGSTPVRQQLEDLLLHHTILPARMSTIAVLSKKKRRADDRVYIDPITEKLLQPLHDKTVHQILPEEEALQPIKDTMRSIAMVLNVALHNFQRTTPKQKAQEEPWLEALFVALCSCAATPVTGDMTAAKHSHSASLLCDLLDACADNNYSPGSGLLESVVRRYSGLCLSQDQDVAWDMVARALRIDPDVFLPRGSRLQNLDIHADAGPSHELIIKQLSAMGWNVDFERRSAANVADLTKSTGSSLPATAFLDQSSLTPEEFLVQVPVALMRAYARARNLTGFLDLWRTELVKSTRHIVIGSGTGSVWEDPSLAVALRVVFESSLTEMQIQDLVTRFADPFGELEEAQNIMYIFTELRQEGQGIGAAANLLLLDAMVAAIQSDAVIKLCQSQLFKLYESLLSIGSKPAINKFPIMHRIWRTLSSIQHIVLPALATAERLVLVQEALGSPCAQAAVETVRDAPTAGGAEVSHRRVSHAVAFLLPLHVDRMPQITTTKVLDYCVDLVLTQKKGFPWVEAAVQSLRTPQVFTTISAARRKKVFQRLLQEANNETQSNRLITNPPAEPQKAVLVVNALIELAKSVFSTDARNDLLDSICDDIQCSDHLDLKNGRLSHVNFGESLLEQFPVGVISRRLRERLLDIVYRAINLSKEEEETEVRRGAVQAHLAFMVKMLEVPNATAAVCKHPESLLTLCDDRDLHDQVCAGLYEELVRRILSPLSQQAPFAQQLGEAVLKAAAGSTSQPQYATWLALRQVVPKLDAEMHQKLLSCEAEAFCALNRQILEGIDDPASIDPQVDQKFATLLESLRIHWHLIENSETLRDELNQWDLLQAVEGHASRLPESRTNVNRFLLATVSGSAFDQCLAVQNALHDGLPLQQQRRLLGDLKVALSRRSAEERMSVVVRLDELLLQPGLRWSFLWVLRVLLTTLPRSVKGLDEFELKADILGRLANEASSCSDAVVFGGICECIKTVLSERSWLVSQYGIDALLGSFAKTTSASGPPLPVELAGGIYIQLCSNITTAVSLHRIKLQGRFHLLMPLVVNLLKCLFVPNSRAAANGALRHPPWLSTESSPLTAKQATTFARLLSTLSSPSMSSVSSYKPRRTEIGSSAPLRDETKVARAHVGEYVPVLISAYCSAQLNGRMQPGVKDALMPGLWSCMETVEMDAWRAMSERLRENERAMWTSVYQEWKRTGGGGRGRDPQDLKK